MAKTAQKICNDALHFLSGISPSFASAMTTTSGASAMTILGSNIKTHPDRLSACGGLGGDNRGDSRGDRGDVSPKGRRLPGETETPQGRQQGRHWPLDPPRGDSRGDVSVSP